MVPLILKAMGASSCDVVLLQYDALFSCFGKQRGAIKGAYARSNKDVVDIFGQLFRTKRLAGCISRCCRGCSRRFCVPFWFVFLFARWLGAPRCPRGQRVQVSPRQQRMQQQLALFSANQYSIQWISKRTIYQQQRYDIRMTPCNASMYLLNKSLPLRIQQASCPDPTLTKMACPLYAYDPLRRATLWRNVAPSSIQVGTAWRRMAPIGTEWHRTAPLLNMRMGPKRET